MKSLKTLIAAGVALSAVSITSYADIDETLTESFDVSKGARFSLDNVNGAVEIEVWNRDVVEVEAKITTDSQESRDRIRVIIEQRGGDVDVQTKYRQDNGWSGRHHKMEVEYTVKVPAYINLDNIELVNGALYIEDVEGDVKASTVNGKINAEGLKGKVQLSTVNGGIRAEFSEQSESASRIDLETVNGSLTLKLPSGFNADVTASTVHGSIDNDFGLRVEKGRYVGSDMEGEIGNGQGRIRLESVNGSIDVLKN